MFHDSFPGGNIFLLGEEETRLVRDAYKFFIKNEVEEALSVYATAILKRYVEAVGIPKEKEAAYVAAMYLAGRHPFSFPNSVSKEEFAERFGLKASSLEWYTESISEKLGFIKIYDYNRFPYYIDPESVIGAVLKSVVKSTVEEISVRMILGIEVMSEEDVVEELVERLVDKLKIVPPVFKGEMHRVIRNLMREELKKAGKRER
ncbi:MAG: hypothetical protein KIH01_01675 [Candidatus Freyarchaeota archaeon]|nr:hypothetical protein [Candidatus Jordarchaeia archaeon]